MAVYVDELRHYKPGHPWSHMMADTLEELHAFAQAIEVKRCWFHNPRRAGMPHYDLNPDQRARAVEAGAVEVTSREMVRKFRSKERP